MATNPRWCQPVRVWRDYLQGLDRQTRTPRRRCWPRSCSTCAPSVARLSLFADLQADTLAAARCKFDLRGAYDFANSLKHTPPLGLLRGFRHDPLGRTSQHAGPQTQRCCACCRSGAHLQHCKGELTEANTRARLKAAEASRCPQPVRRPGSAGRLRPDCRNPAGTSGSNWSNPAKNQTTTCRRPNSRTLSEVICAMRLLW